MTFTLPEVQVRRNDDLDLRSRIMNMTIEERRSIGLARNTYFYMKRNLKTGKKIQIYGKVMEKLAKQ